MLISPKYCKAKIYMADDEADEVEDDDNQEVEDGIDEDHEDVDENLGIHVVGQRLRLRTPSTPSCSKSIN